ncbi:hypothetical protein BM44_4268 [Burkholderia mallei NCTC 10247]|nr:hypothetical protein DM55_4305 [Burkholderia mallei]AIS26470.1 hypothetical protein BM44_4268 [Burkholderia mallei NCTC 10247]EEP84584.1 polyketide synthase [Burkholderia mallei GB8 horse 4]AIO61283.1 hypothetical protein DM76_3258 [Burkholderia mallei]AIP73627.1 hypothetical protein DM51_4870 [Burkholderia mallei]
MRGARAPGAAGDRDAAWTERIAAAARLDADGAAALREWLNDAAPAAGADDARLARGDAIATDILEPYRFEPDARAFFDDAFRECLNRWSRRLLEQDGATWLSDVVLVPFLVAAARARESAPSCEARSIRALADAFGADLRRLLDASRVLDDGDIGDIGAMRASLECVTSFRDGLLHADRRLSNGAPAACRPQVCAAAYEDLEAAILRRFDASANARVGRRPRYLAFVGGEDRDLPERLVERIVRQGEPRNGGGTGVEPPRIVIPRADAAPADDSAQPDPAAAFGVDAIDDVLPVCVLSGVDDAAAIRRLRALLVRGAHAAVVLACHGLPAASAALPDAWAAARPARMLRLLGFGAARDAQAFLVDMAADGLFARTPPIGYPRASRARRATLGEFEARDYRVRPAAPHDLPALQALELACWPAALRMPEATLAARVGRHAAGQFVLELDAREAAAGPRRLAGVIYSQRIASVRALDGVDADTVDRLHEDGGPVIQLLAVNVDPACQSRRLGDQLLEFMLQRCAALADVELLVAVTLCRDFHKHASMPIDDYLRLRNAFGFLADPILRFHELHGARIERPMPGYRPRDVRNAGFGVLVSYDLARRARNEAGAPAASDAPAAPDGAPARADGGHAGDAAPPRPERDAATPADPDALDAFIEAEIRRIVGGGAELAYARDLPLMQLGLDSVGLLELAEALALRCGVALPATFLFQHNTPARIVAYFDASRHAPPRAGCDTGCETAGAAAAAARPSSRGCPATEPGAAREPAQAAPFAPDGIAIVGIACRLPGGLDTPEAFWDALKAGACVVGELPGDRWTWPADIDPGARHRGIDRGGFLDDIRSFDAGLFRLSPKEVATMDPQQRILLELAWEAIERAGHCADAVAGSRTGVYVGASGSDYRLLLERAGTGVDAHVATGASMAVIANRISYTYDLRGPSIQVDTACSSSLVALHQAVQALRAGECDQALVGGVNVICHPGNTIAYYKAGMLSPQGRCKTLDDAADGYVRSEGAVMLMLRRLEQAVADGDPIHAVIRGSACNHGGLTGGLTVPHPDRQADLLRAAWAAARVSADDIGYLEMHGTGTRLGDPIEVRGLADAFGARDDAAARGTCGIGSVKSNLGHLEAAAGLAGVLKTVLALKHREVPATLHFSRLNAQISLARTPFAVVDTHRAWPARGGARRLAGVSSFGSGGANAHVVLEEYPSEAPPRAAAGDALFVLSAHCREQLAEYARRVLAYCERRLQSGDDAPAAAAVAHALQRRQAMAWRLAFVAASLEEAVRRLRAFAAGAAQPGTFVGGGAPKTSVADFVNQNPDVQQVVSAWLRERQLAKLARYWADGVRIANWSALYDARPACVPLPCYPFARERHWIAARPAEASEATAAAAPPAAPDDAYRAAARGRIARRRRRVVPRAARRRREFPHRPSPAWAEDPAGRRPLRTGACRMGGARARGRARDRIPRPRVDPSRRCRDARARARRAAAARRGPARRPRVRSVLAARCGGRRRARACARHRARRGRAARAGARSGRLARAVRRRARRARARRARLSSRVRADGLRLRARASGPARPALARRRTRRDGSARAHRAARLHRGRARAPPAAARLARRGGAGCDGGRDRPRRARRVARLRAVLARLPRLRRVLPGARVGLGASARRRPGGARARRSRCLRRPRPRLGEFSRAHVPAVARGVRPRCRGAAAVPAAVGRAAAFRRARERRRGRCRALAGALRFRRRRGAAARSRDAAGALAGHVDRRDRFRCGDARKPVRGQRGATVRAVSRARA